MALVGCASELTSVRASRVLIAFGVVLVGLCAALPFRQSTPSLAPVSRPVVPLALTLRQPASPLELAPKNDVSPAVGLEAIAASVAPAASDPRVLAAERSPDLKNLAPPPALPVSFQPLAERPPASDWRPERPPLPAKPAAKPRRYRVRDGDTLEKLAERFLANRERAAEIFEANRHVLARPDLLPLGVTIILPSRESTEELEPVKQSAGGRVFDVP
jgi:phage tail protein X